MKAAQVTGSTNNNGNSSSHSGLLGSGGNNIPSSSPGPQGQNMMQGRIKHEGNPFFHLYHHKPSIKPTLEKEKTKKQTVVSIAGGGSSSGSPATGGYMQHPSPTPSSTPGSDMSGQPAPSPGGGWDVKPQQPVHSHPPHPTPHPHPPTHNYLPQYSWYPTDNPGLLT